MTADEFRTALRALGLRQNRLAAALGVDFNTVSRWAVGTVPVPKYAQSYLRVLDLLVEYGLSDRIAELN